MKLRFCAALLLAALSICIFAGCAPGAADRPVTPSAPTPTAAPTVPATQPPDRITAEAAEDIALAHAGLTREQLRYLRTEFDYDDGVPEYDIDFYAGGWDYDYEVHAITGQILRNESEPEAKQTAATEPAATAPPATEPSATQSQRLTEEEVIAIALKDAGLSEDQVTRLRAEFDYDDGVPEYEVDFHHAGYEYDYEIHAETGVIRSRDKDRED